MSDIPYYNAFNQIAQIGAVRFHRLIKHFSSLKSAWTAPLAELVAAGIEPGIAEVVAAKRAEIDPDEEMKKVQAEGVEIILYSDPRYPRLLKEIYNPPALLYLKGNAELLAGENAVAVVGTRKISYYGKQVVPLFVRDLARAGITVISGLALGIDELAHRICVEEGGKTIAVLGSGIADKSIYPSTNRTVAKRIIETNGAVISELPIYALPLKIHFPFRNRIISGMSVGIVVIEADETSGALITAKLALEQNRQVFAVPGSVFNRTSIGPNNLIKMGARAVTSADEVLEELNLKAEVKQSLARQIIPESPTEEKLLNLLSDEPSHIDRLIKESSLSPGDVGSTLTMMELKGKVKNLGGMQYVKAR